MALRPGLGDRLRDPRLDLGDVVAVGNPVRTMDDVVDADDERLADAIARLMDDPELRIRLGKSARLRVQEKYDLRKNVKKLAEIYRQHLTNGSS